MTILNKVSNKTLMPGITPVADVPDAPTIGAATSTGSTTATVAYTAAATGGTATTFTATSTPGSLTGTGSSPITVSGLTGSTAYTFKVKGTNTNGVIGPESSASNSITTDVPIPSNSYFPIGSYTVPSGTQASIIFSGIPQTYSHLQVRFFMVSTSASSSSYTYVNGDTTQANYKEHVLYGSGASASAGSYSNSYMPQFIGGAATASPGPYIMDIFDYTNTNKYKTFRGLGGVDVNGSGGYLGFESMLWMNTAAITSLQFSPNGVSWSQYANISIYGVN